MDEMKEAVQNKKGFVKAMWCGEEECEDEIKAQTGGVNIQMYPDGGKSICPMCAYAAANLRNIWFTGEERIKLRLAVINGIQRKMKGGDFGNGGSSFYFSGRELWLQFRSFAQFRNCIIFSLFEAR